MHADAAGQKNGASFWFENRNNAPVIMRLHGVSCLSCSGGRMAPIPPEVTRDIIQMSIVSGLPQGLFSGLPLGMAGPAANLDPARLQWQSATFKDDPHASYKVPAADNRDGWSPQWGILELQFTAPQGPKTLTADFVVQVEGAKQAASAKFEIAFEGVDPFDIAADRSIDVGELEEKSEPRTYGVLVYSSTRGPHGNGLGDLEPPVARVDLLPNHIGEVGPFVSVGKPERVPESELEPLMYSVSEQLKKGVRITAAYRMTITVAPRVGDKRVDLGPLEREIWFTVPGASNSKPVRVKAAHSRSGLAGRRPQGDRHRRSLLRRDN